MKKRKPPAFFDLARWGRGIGAIKVKKIINPPRPVNETEALKEQFRRDQLPNFGLGKCEILPHPCYGSYGGESGGEPVKGKTFSCAENFGKALERRGFKRLGSGAYSTVYGKAGSDRVVKVTRCLDDWIDYIQWGVKKGYSGTYVPKVYSWKRYAGDPKSVRYSWQTSQFAVAIVEKMEYTLGSEKGIQSDFVPLEYLVRAAVHSGNVMCSLIVDDIAPGYLDFVKELKSDFDSDDMYGKNLMVRPNGTFCVTDPVCGKIKTTSTRLRSSDFMSLAPASLGYLCLRLIS